jgi:nitrogen fixation/metabolism regulation signal transduction histidine kinase
MRKQRKQYVLDKKFQYGIAMKAVIFPLLTLILISTVLIYFAADNNRNIEFINSNQASIIDTFLSLPQLVNPKNPVTKDATAKFEQNLGKSREIQKNSRIVLYFLIAMTIIQTVVIFTLSIFYSHKISGPIFVITRYLRDIRDGKKIQMRPLRKSDEFQEFYGEICETMDYLIENKKSKKSAKDKK